MAATCLPYLLCWYATPPGTVYPGILYNADDHGVYFAWIRQALDGHFFFRNLFTNEPQLGRYVHLYFWLLGTLSRRTGLSIALSYHLGRVVMGVLVLVLVYRLGAFFTSDRFTRRVIFWTTAVSAGLGWLSMGPRVQFSQPVDCWQPEAFTFESLYTNGLFAASLALMLGVVIGLLNAQRTGRARHAAGAGLCGLLLANVHTYDMLTLAAVWGVYLFVLAVVVPRTLRQRLRDAILAAVIAAPGFAYEVWFYLRDPVFQRRVAVETGSPSFRLYLLGYGLLLPLAALGVWLLFRSRRVRAAPHLLLPPVWVLVGFALAYLPVSFQRKLVMGLHFPIALLAGLGIAGLARLLSRVGRADLKDEDPTMDDRRPTTETPSVPNAVTQTAQRASGTEHRAPNVQHPTPQTQRRLRAVAAVLVAVTAITSVRFVARDLRMAIDENVSSTGLHPIWWPAADFKAMNWIRQNRSPGAVIYCYPPDGLLIPAVTGMTVYAGHWGETPDFPAKMRTALSFFRGDLGDAGIRMLAETGATDLFLGHQAHVVSEDARNRGRPGFAPAPPLQQEFQQGDARVYAIPASPAPASPPR